MRPPSGLWSGQQREARHVPRSYDAEVPPVECGDLAQAVAFGGCDDRCVDGAEGKVVVGRYELGHPERVRYMDGLHHEVRGQVAEEPDLRLPRQAASDEMGHLAHDERWNDQRARVGFEQLQAGRVVSVIGVYVGVERAGVDDQRDGLISEASISSIRSDVSLVPLRPAPAACSRRLLPAPRCSSSAVRVTCAIVTPCRRAACRSCASRSSGSFTVVRCMYASIPDAVVQHVCAHLRLGGWGRAGTCSQRSVPATACLRPRSAPPVLLYGGNGVFTKCPERGMGWVAPPGRGVVLSMSAAAKGGCAELASGPRGHARLSICRVPACLCPSGCAHQGDCSHAKRASNRHLSPREACICAVSAGTLSARVYPLTAFAPTAPSRPPLARRACMRMSHFSRTPSVHPFISAAT